MKFTIDIDCGNAAFGEDDHERGEELARILKIVARQLEDGFIRGFCYDANGNTVGTYKTFEEDLQ